MKKIILLLISVLILFYSTYYLIGIYGKDCTCYGIEVGESCIGIKSACYGLPFNQLLVPKKTNINNPNSIRFNDQVIVVGDTFNFKPTEQCIGDIKSKLISINEESITIEVQSEQKLDQKYYDVNPFREVVIKNGDCISSEPLCTDVYYSYCFTSDSSVFPPKYTYEIKGESTLPKPSFLNL